MTWEDPCNSSGLGVVVFCSLPRLQKCYCESLLHLAIVGTGCNPAAMSAQATGLVCCVFWGHKACIGELSALLPCADVVSVC